MSNVMGYVFVAVVLLGMAYIVWTRVLNKPLPWVKPVAPPVKPPVPPVPPTPPTPPVI